MTPEIHETLMFFAERRAVLNQTFASAVDHYLLARVQKLPVLSRRVAAEIHGDEAALVLHDGLLRSYLQEMAA